VLLAVGRRSPASTQIFAGPALEPGRDRFRGSSAPPHPFQTRLPEQAQRPGQVSAPPHQLTAAAAARASKAPGSPAEMFAGDQQAFDRPWPPPGPLSCSGRQLQSLRGRGGSAHRPAGVRAASIRPTRQGHERCPGPPSPIGAGDRQAGRAPAPGLVHNSPLADHRECARARFTRGDRRPSSASPP